MFFSSHSFPRACGDVLGARRRLRTLAGLRCGVVLGGIMAIGGCCWWGGVVFCGVMATCAVVGVVCVGALSLPPRTFPARPTIAQRRSLARVSDSLLHD